MMIFYLSIGTVSVVGNLIVLFVVYKSKQLRHSQYVYNCSIALSDIIWSFTTSYFFVFSFVKLLWVDHTNLREIYLSSFKHENKKIKNENNITTLKYKVNQVELLLKALYSNIFIEIVLMWITPVTLLVSFISLIFASIYRYI